MSFVIGYSDFLRFVFKTCSYDDVNASVCDLFNLIVILPFL